MTTCDECGSQLLDGRACEDDFYLMLHWEQQEPALGRVHHLMVLAYHLQHPSRYSRAGLRHARGLLATFIEDGRTTEDVRREQRAAVDSGARDWHVTAREDDVGVYAAPVTWTMHASDVVAGGSAAYCDNVEAWAASIHAALTPELVP